MAIKEYEAGTRFPGVIGRTIHESEPAWPRPVRAKPDAPNVLVIVLDDTGFGHLGCYGSPIRTPNIDRLAKAGLLFNNMHTTALCSPSRACILTGRNHHSNGLALITEGATGFPGSNGIMPLENGFISEILQTNGYATFAVGKWHLNPVEHGSAAGPFDRWPLGRGFERYYGFLGGDTHQYYPDLVCDNHQVKPPKTPEEGYHLTEDLVDRATEMIADLKQVVPDKPFFMYFCTGAMHAPHQVPREWIDKYKGAFDDGWDVYRERVFQQQQRRGLMPEKAKLSPRDPDVQEWASLPAKEKRLYARMMEVFAGFLEHTDHHIGRLLEFLGRIDQLDNTLIMLVSDNGASAEGGPHGSVNENLFFNNVPETLEAGLAAIDELGGPKHFNHYPWGWAWAGNAPFRRWKRETYRGGVSDPFIVHWPEGIPEGGQIRTQYAHLIDILPTILDALGLEPPKQIRGVTQSPLEGVSFAHVFGDATAPTRHHTQYYEMLGHRALYHDGWRAVCPVPGPSFAEAGMGVGEMKLDEARLRELDAHGWELYNLDDDCTETKNLAAQHRDRLIEMIVMWYVEAGKYNVLPLDSRVAMRLAEERPQVARPRTRYVFYPDTGTVANKIAPKVLNRPFSITATAEVADGSEGVLVAQGGASGGHALFIKDRRLHYVYNYLGVQRFQVTSAKPIPHGLRELRVEFEPTDLPDLAHGKGAPGKAQLYIDRELVAEAELPVTIPIDMGITEGLTVGRDEGSVVDHYAAPFRFTGKLEQIAIDVSGELIQDHEATMRAIMAHQ